MALTDKQRAYAESAITQAVRKFLDELSAAHPVMELGEDHVLKFTATFTTDPNMNVWGGEPKPRDELGQYLDLAISMGSTRSA